MSMLRNPCIICRRAGHRTRHCPLCGRVVCGVCLGSCTRRVNQSCMECGTGTALAWSCRIGRDQARRAGHPVDCAPRPHGTE